MEDLSVYLENSCLKRNHIQVICVIKTRTSEILKKEDIGRSCWKKVIGVAKISLADKQMRKWRMILIYPEYQSVSGYSLHTIKQAKEPIGRFPTRIPLFPAEALPPAAELRLKKEHWANLLPATQTRRPA